MGRRPAVRSEETRRAVLQAAGKLFAERGFDSVTIREIASEAGCSHTAIYLYFKDKEALLNELALGPLLDLRQRMEAEVQHPARSAEDRVRRTSRTYVEFCLAHRAMYPVLLIARATRVDVEAHDLEIQRERNRLFASYRRALAEFLGLRPDEERSLASARVAFFTLHGIVMTYQASPESYDQLMQRLGPTFELAIAVMLAGLFQQVRKEATLE